MSRSSPVKGGAFSVGDRVAANWKGGEQGWPGIVVGVTTVQGINTYDVQYDDFSFENGMIPSLVNTSRKKLPVDPVKPCSVCRGKFLWFHECFHGSLIPISN